jgi:transposase
MENIYEASAHLSEQVDTGAEGFGGWLTVQDAVAYCLSKGLSRTAKTVRKWAQRARDPQSGTAEILVKAQDTENGFRWLLERSSLDVKIEQEKQFEVRKDGVADGEHLLAKVATGAHMSAPVRAEETTTESPGTDKHLSEQVGTGAQAFTPVSINDHMTEPVSARENTSAPVGTGASQDNTQMIEFLMKQIDTKDQQLAVKDRQIESMLERDHETNILIQGLQTSLTGVVQALPGARRDERAEFHAPDRSRVDNSGSSQRHDAVQ